MSDFQIGQIFENESPPEVASFCSKNNAKIEVISTVEKTVQSHTLEGKQAYAVFADGTKIKLWPYNKQKYAVGQTVAMKQYKIVEIPAPTTEEVAAQVRAQRDAMIARTDFMMMPDYPISEEDKALVEAYRQALRDIPQQESFPSNVQWPVAPQCLKGGLP